MSHHKGDKITVPEYQELDKAQRKSNIKKEHIYSSNNWYSEAVLIVLWVPVLTDLEITP